LTRVRQSGEKAARHGHISRAGQAHARGLLIEAAHVAIRTPGPLRAFHARIAARRGKQIALCATARKLAMLAWHLLSKDEDYRHGAPTITQRKLAHAPAQGRRHGPPNQPRWRDQAQGARAPLPGRGRTQLPPLRRDQGARKRRGRRHRGRDC
jgi:transposase